MRYLYLTTFWFSSLYLALAQEAPKFSADDATEIRAEARKVIETHLSDLLNSIASSEMGQQGRRLIIVNSFIPGENQIFTPIAIIEDDTSPEYTSSGKGTDLKVQTYLEKLDLFYTKSTEYSIKLSEVNVTEVKQGKEAPYVQVHFRSYFTNTHRNKPTLKYSPVLRTAEMTAEKVDNQWKVLITGIRYYKKPAPETVVASTPTKIAQTQATPPVKPVVEQTTVKKSKPAETSQETTPRTTAVKTEREVPPASKPEPATAEPKPAVAKVPDKTATKPPAEKTADLAPEKPNTALIALEAKAAKYKRQAVLIKTGSGLAVVGAVATYFLVNTAYTDYKAGIEKSNTEFQTWWDAKDAGGRINGQNFGEINNYKAQPKSIIEFGSPGIYFVGAGIVAAGVLWVVGSGSSRKAKDLRNQLKQKKLSLSPQLNAPQRYAGLQVRYSF